MKTAASRANRPTQALVIRAQSVLAMTHEQFGGALGASKRTSARWAVGQSSVGLPALHRLARLVHPKDPALAAEIAAAASQSLESLGIVVRPPPPIARPAVSPLLIVDAVVCAAADALDAPPSKVRATLLAAFRRARELGLRVEDVENALSAPASAKKATPYPST